MATLRKVPVTFGFVAVIKGPLGMCNLNTERDDEHRSILLVKCDFYVIRMGII
jgi:hypothetical protein